MTKAFQSIGIIGRYRSEHVTDTITALLDFLEKSKFDVTIEEDTAAVLSKPPSCPILERNKLAKQSDLLIVIGGDGSMLNTARCAVRHDTPVLGINRGRLGFLTDIKPNELETEVAKVLAGKFLEERRFLLNTYNYTHNNSGNQLTNQLTNQDEALNDVVVMPAHMPHMIEFDIIINQQFVSKQRADGLIVATPTGSTAYALSGGGPILHPSLDALVILPMFPHDLSSRPIVVDGNDEIIFKYGEYNDCVAKLSCDGRDSGELKPGDEVHIRKKTQQLRLIHPADHHFFDSLRSKMGWAKQNHSHYHQDED